MEVGINRNYGCRATCAQVLVALAFHSLNVNVGMIICMPVLIIGALRTGDSSISLSEEEASWFGGLIFMIQPLGSVVSGFLQDLLGRKKSMMFVNVPQFVAWLMIYHATSKTTLFAAVILLGLSIGFMEAPVLSYIGEVSEPRLRGVLSTVGGIFFNIGLTLESVIGATTDWRSMALITSAAPVAAFVALSLLPDSPAWLVSKGRVEEARKSYQWLRGWVAPHVIQDELDTLVDYVKRSRNPRVVSNADYRAVSTELGEMCGPADRAVSESRIKNFLHPSVQRPLRLIVLYFFVAACASLCGMKPFFINILKDLEVPIEPRLVIVAGNILTTTGALTSTFSMPLTGKRGLTFISLSISFCCCYGLALYIALGLKVPWIVLVLFAGSYFAAPLGIICIPWILISELFPLKARGVAGGVAAALGYMIMFIIIKTFYNLVSLVGLSGVCFLYGTVGLLGLVFFYLRLPETEGVPLHVIEAMFSDRKDIPHERQTEEIDSAGGVKIE